MTKVIAYIRVSTDRQAEEGVSLDAQRAQLTAYATLYGLDVVEWVEDAQSAKDLARPGLARAIGMLAEDRADGLLVAKLDRLTRSVRDLGSLIEGALAEKALFSVSEQIDTRSASGRLVLNVLASVSQWEREAIGERTSAAMQHMRRNNKYTGGPVPYGWRLVDGALGRVEAEQATIARVRELRAEGLSWRKIAGCLENEGKSSRNGKPFAAQQLANMSGDEQ